MAIITTNNAELRSRPVGASGGAPKVDPRRSAPPRYERLTENPGPLRRKTIPKREVFLAILLTCLGGFLLVMGAIVFSRQGVWQSFPFTAMGLVTFIPGFYHAFIMVMIKRGEPGFTYDMLGKIDAT